MSPEIVAAIAVEQARHAAFAATDVRLPPPISLGILALKSGPVLARTVRRFAQGRDHGFHETLVEEVLRAYYLAGAGFDVWAGVKRGAAAAFLPDPNTSVGTKMIQELIKLFDTGKRPHITLIGHSAGGFVAGECATLLKKRGIVDKGMRPKVQSAVRALQEGVQRVHFIDGRMPHSLLLEIFTDKGVGTEIVHG